MQVLQAQPIAGAGALGEQSHGLLRLTLAHRELVVASPTHRPFRVFLQLLARIRTGRDDEQHGRRRIGLVAHAREGERRRCDRLDAELRAHERIHRGLQPIRSERLDQEKPRERAGVRGGHARLRDRRVDPCAPRGAVAEAEIRRVGREG